MGYETYRIADLIDEIAMGPFGSNIKVSCFVDSGVPVLNGSNLEGFSLSEKTFRYVTREKADSLNKANAHRGDIVITHRGTLGQIVFIPQDSKYDRYVISQSQFRVRCNDKVLPEYLVYYFHTPIGQHKLLSNASQVGVPALARPSSTFQQIEVVLPELSIQKCVVEIISTIQKKIVNNQELNDNLQQQLFSLYENMATASPCLKEYTLSNLCDFQEGYVNPPQTHPEYFDGEVKWLRAVDINESFIIETSRTLTKAGFESAKKSALLFEPNTIAISKSGTIGRLGIIADYMCGNRAVINIAPHDTNMLAFIYCFLKSKQREFPDMAVGSVQKNLYVSLLEPLSVSIPDNESLTAFNAVGASILGMIHNNCVENTDLANLRDTILPKLMSGEIDVSSVLL